MYFLIWIPFFLFILSKSPIISFKFLNPTDMTKHAHRNVTRINISKTLERTERTGMLLLLLQNSCWISITCKWMQRGWHLSLFASGLSKLQCGQCNFEVVFECFFHDMFSGLWMLFECKLYKKYLARHALRNFGFKEC